MTPAWAKRYIGIPFKYQGRDKNGIDCYGLVRVVAKEVFNIGLPDYLDTYSEHPSQVELGKTVELSLLNPHWRRVYCPLSGDLVLLRINGLPIHCGLIIEYGVMLHITEHTHSCIERLFSPIWANRIAGYYHYE